VWSVADEVQAIGPGWLARTTTLPAVWALNQLHVIGPANAGQVIALAQEHQADLSFHHIVVEHGATALELEEVVAAGGWKADREVLMALQAEPVREVATQAVTELGEDEMLAMMRCWMIEEFPGIDATRLDQVEEYNRREGQLWDERRFGAVDDAGAPVAITKLRTRGTVAWVEDVYTVPEQRKRGLARMLVSHAATQATATGHDLTFIIADDNDWPKHLYGEIGFRPVGFTWTFHRGAAS